MLSINKNQLFSNLLVLYCSNIDEKIIYLSKNDIYNNQTKIEKAYPCTFEGVL